MNTDASGVKLFSPDLYSICNGQIQIIVGDFYLFVLVFCHVAVFVIHVGFVSNRRDFAALLFHFYHFLAIILRGAAVTPSV